MQTLIRRFTLRLGDMATISRLSTAAEDHARQQGDEAPGEEHYVMAALDLPDGTARAAFAAIGADPDAFAGAITQQYTDALSAIGVSGQVMQAPIASVGPRSVAFRAKPSVSTLMRKLKGIHQRDASMPLLGAHVLLVIAGNAHGVGVRALRAQQIDPVALADAAEQILAGHRASSPSRHV